MTQTLIEKLQKFAAMLEDKDYTSCTVDADDLRAILEEYKATEQAPLIVTKEMIGMLDRSMDAWKDNPRVELYEPQLPDETVKDAARYRKLKEAIMQNGKSGVFGLAAHLGWQLKTFDCGMDAAIDEAMKADNGN